MISKEVVLKKLLVSIAVMTAFVLVLPGTAMAADVYGPIYNPDTYTPKLCQVTIGSGTTLTIYTGSSTAEPYYTLDGGKTMIDVPPLKKTISIVID